MKLKSMALIGVATLGMSGLTLAVEQTIAATDARDQTFTAATDNSMFVVNNFDYTLSANVGMNSTENAGSFAVGTASNKGRNAYTGSSNGGSVTTCGPATTDDTAPTVPSPSLTATAGCNSGGS